MKTAILEAAHLPAVAELETLCFGNPWSEQALSLLLEGGNFGIVALEEDTPCAYAGLIVAPDEGEITNVATHPSKRRMGYAKAVLLALTDEAARRGVRRITLEVRESNTAAKALYESLGFSLCGKRKHFYRFPREDALILEKTIG